MSKYTLTPRQHDVLEIIRRYINAKGYGPTYEEIADALSIGITSAKQHVTILISKGYVVRDYGVLRSIRIVKEVERT